MLDKTKTAAVGMNMLALPVLPIEGISQYKPLTVMSSNITVRIVINWRILMLPLAHNAELNRPL